MLRESQLFLTVLGRRTWEVSEINGRTAKKRKANAMIGKRRMSSGGERSGDANERPRRGMEVVGGGSAFSCSRALSPGSWFYYLGRKRVGFGKPGFGRQMETFSVL